MARSIIQIQDQIKTTLVSNMAGAGIIIDPTTWSRTDIRGIFIYTIAFCWWTIESLFDVHKAETDDKISRLKPHSSRWYAEKAKQFRYGFNLIAESDQYDDAGITEDQIATSLVIAHCAVVEQEISTNRFGLRIKLATLQGDDLAELPGEKLDAFREYMARIKDAGVGLLITSGPADSLKLKLTIYYNPLVLNNQGQRLDGTNMQPVQTAIKEYLKNLPFNGVFVLAYLVDIMQQVDGVVIPQIQEAQARYGLLPYTNFGVEYIPDAGYLRIGDASDLEIQFVPKSAI